MVREEANNPESFIHAPRTTHQVVLSHQLSHQGFKRFSGRTQLRLR
jgi:hypothetical protein